MFEIVVAKGTEGSLLVRVIEDFDEEREEWEENGEKIIAQYSLEGSLQALGILVACSFGHQDNFGDKVEELLTKIVQEMHNKGYDSATEAYRMIMEEE